MSLEHDRRDRRSNETLERFREPLFIAGALFGVLLVALGLAFLVLGISMDTTPPAPYFQSTLDMYLVIGGSTLAVVVGALVVRFSARFAGW